MARDMAKCKKSIFMPEWMWDWLKGEAEASGETTAGLVRQAVLEYIPRRQMIRSGRYAAADDTLVAVAPPQEESPLTRA